MNKEQAEKLVGKKGIFGQAQQAKALQMLTFENTREDWRRLLALKALGYRVAFSRQELEELSQ
jgi:hypothetical protein